MRPVSLVCTVLNECRGVDALLDSIAAQSRVPDEIVLVDGGSRDGTPDRARAWAQRHPGITTRVIVAQGANISQGRNCAIRAASHDLLAVTDAGVHLPPEWLERLVEPFSLSDPPDAVSGFFASDPRSTFELALGATTLPDRSEIDPRSFLPSSRSLALSRTAWLRAGGYPEWLDYCEDLVLDLNLHSAGMRFGWAPAALTGFRPRAAPTAFALQYFRYARGDGKAQLWRRRHLIRYGTYLGALLALRLLPRRLAIIALAIGGGVYVRRPYFRLAARRSAYPPGSFLVAAALIPPLRAIGDLAKMVGYPVGIFWRLRNRPPDWRVREPPAER